MAAKITNPWKNKRMTGGEVYARKIERLEQDIAHAERVLAWQIEQGYAPQAEISRKEIAKLQKRLAKLI
jgi:phage host-nuclease inhibitor protein Gam